MNSTQSRADASPDRTITREELPEMGKVNRTVREYVEQVERENVKLRSRNRLLTLPPPKLTINSTARHVSKLATHEDLDNRPGAALSSKRGASGFAYYDNYLIDNRSCIIAGVMATPARLSQEIIAARQIVGTSEKTLWFATRQRHC